MSFIHGSGLWLLFTSLFACLTVLLFNPLWLLCCYRSRKTEVESVASDPLSISLITVVRNGEALIDAKLENSLSLLFPGDDYEIIMCSDASTDTTLQKLRANENPRLRILQTELQQGKNRCLNRAIAQSRGEILVFTDADALLAPDALLQLTRHFSDPEVGGVCGQRKISERGHALHSGQSDYIRFDSVIKLLESQQGRITSNDGKLFAIRKSLAAEIDPAVTDDFYSCLTVLEAGSKFIFEPLAQAFIQLPSRSAAHELVRRRRIVTRSLRGLFLKRQLLNPFRYGSLSLRLLVNKVLRRLLPFFLLSLLFGSLLTANLHPLIFVFCLLQLSGYALVLARYLAAEKTTCPWPPGERLIAALYYFCLGNIGNLYGVYDFLHGRKIDRWDPLKK